MDDTEAVQGDSAFFTGRGIADAIWRSRPYLWWGQSTADPARDPFAGTTPAQRAFVTRITSQSPGWVITRHAPPMSEPLPPIFPELRPISPVKTQGPRVHWHGDGEPPADLKPWSKMPGDRTTWSSHIDRDKATDDHRGFNTELLHSHQAIAKYVFATSPKIDGAYVHDHETSWKRTAAAARPERRQGHVDKHHAGIDQVGPHTHQYRAPDPEAPAMARRLDVHPLGVEKLASDEVVFLALEGCIKADAILSAGGAVFSVPSVSLWDAAELQSFVTEHLRDKVVIVVPDSDWHTNAQVINQAKMCGIRLRRLGVMATHVAAPPMTYNGRPTKGADDFLAAGGTLGELVVIDFVAAPGLATFIDSFGFRRDRARRDEDVLRDLAAYTGPDGVFSAPLRTLARVIGVNAMKVSRAVADLATIGAVTVEGDLTTRRGFPFSRELDWKHRPTITLAPGLRSMPRPPQNLEDIISSYHLERTPSWMTRAYSQPSTQ